MRRQLLTAMVWLVAAHGTSRATDIDKGRALATRLCAACHMHPGQGEKQGPTGLAGFTAIANRPGQRHDYLVRWLRTPPVDMPDHRLTWDEADALAAFIMSLRSPP